MTQLLLLAIFLAASLSLASYAWCWHDIRKGRPHIISLRQITTIMDRNQLNTQFGPPEPGYYYPLSPEKRAGLLRRRRRFFMIECAADITCAVGAWLAMTGEMDPGILSTFVVLGGICQGLTIAYSLWLVRKWEAQLREEIENPED